MNRTITVPDNIREIIDIIYNNGYAAYAVGGCIRDSLLDRSPHDWDVTTSASPAAVKKIFRRTVDTGIEHGTVTVLIGNTSCEVTTYRVDGQYKDNRHPESVRFTRSLEEDLKRRDFTINAMAYNDRRGLIDPFGGQEDLERGVIRCVGNPKERFSEDALRILRAVRFSAQLGFRIEERTRQAVVLLAENLGSISAERICSELVKILVSDHPERIREAFSMGVTSVILPEFDRMMKTPQNSRHHCFSVGEHTLEVLKNVPPKKRLRLAALFHDIGKPESRKTDPDGTDHFKGHALCSEQTAKSIMKRLKMDNETLSDVSFLVRYHDWHLPAEEPFVRRLAAGLGTSRMEDFFLLQRADILAQSDYRREEKLALLTETMAVYERIRERGDCLSIRELAVGGRDLLDLGIPKGPWIGQYLDLALDDVLENHEHNNKTYLINMIQRRWTTDSTERNTP